MTTPLRPEQTRALAYLQRKGTDAPVEQLRRRLADSFAEFESMIEAVPLPLRERSPGPGRWSAQEVVDHLIESDRPAVAQLAALLGGLTPETGAIPAGLQSPDPLSRGWDDLAAELKRVHASLIALLEKASDSCSLAVRVPVVMVLKVSAPGGAQESLEWEEHLDWKAFVQTIRIHTIEHRSQIERTLRELSDAELTAIARLST